MTQHPQTNNNPNLQNEQKSDRITEKDITMKTNITLCSLLFALCSLGYAHAATTQWWLQPTVCRLDPTNCYSTMGAGYESNMWDSTANCWGLKIICPDALNETTTAPRAMTRADIADKKKINQDFNTELLSITGDCFGRRKTSSDGTTASVNGNDVYVWCPGILTSPDEFLANGEITYGAQPTCGQLASDGYAAVVNGRCYGKYFDEYKYFIECGTAIQPTRLIVLNGADPNAPATNAPRDMESAKRLFDKMYDISREQNKKYFEK